MQHAELLCNSMPSARTMCCPYPEGLLRIPAPAESSEVTNLALQPKLETLQPDAPQAKKAGQPNSKHYPDPTTGS